MNLKSFAALFLATFISISAHADDKDAASKFVNDIGKQAVSILGDRDKSKEEKTTALEAMFENTVDIEWIGKFVLGRGWKSATDTQKQSYMNNYKSFLIKHYTANLTEFSSVDFKITRITPEDNGGNVVTMKIERPNQEDIVVDYTIRKKPNDGFKVYDITIEGVSMITTQRSEFASVVEQNGIDYLIAQLEQRSKKEEKRIN